ncbi:MAG: hypothetical protein LBF16_08135, partial [Pseudomonadales bacterium]|nr:hypothetical protein [Pseudomonadales bacterium]
MNITIDFTLTNTNNNLILLNNSTRSVDWTDWRGGCPGRTLARLFGIKESRFAGPALCCLAAIGLFAAAPAA